LTLMPRLLTSSPETLASDDSAELSQTTAGPQASISFQSDAEQGSVNSSTETSLNQGGYTTNSSRDGETAPSDPIGLYSSDTFVIAPNIPNESALQSAPNPLNIGYSEEQFPWLVSFPYELSSLALPFDSARAHDEPALASSKAKFYISSANG